MPCIWYLAGRDASLVGLSESPCVNTRLSRYGLNYCCLLVVIRFPLSCGCSYISVAHKLLYCWAVQDPEVLVRFGLERRRLVYTLNKIIEGGDVVPRLTWYGS